MQSEADDCDESFWESGPARLLIELQISNAQKEGNSFNFYNIPVLHFGSALSSVSTGAYAAGFPCARACVCVCVWALPFPLQRHNGSRVAAAVATNFPPPLSTRPLCITLCAIAHGKEKQSCRLLVLMGESSKNRSIYVHMYVCTYMCV